MNEKLLRKELLRDTAERPNWLQGEEGIDPNQIHTVHSFPAQRVTVAGPEAGKPSVVQMSSGEILVSYIKGYRGNLQDTRIEIVRSADGGTSWSEPICAVDPVHSPGDSYLIPLHDDHLLLTYMHLVKADARPWRGPFLCESADGGRTWSAPWQVDISQFCPGPYGVGDRSHVVLPDGRFLFFVGTYEIPRRPLEFVMVSYDKGHTFPEHYQVSDIAGDSTFALCSDGTIAGALRVNADNYPHRGAHPELAAKGEAVHFMAFTRSADEGKTWSAPVPITGYNEIPGHIIQLEDGRLLLAFGVRHYPVGVQAILSNRDAMTWDLERRLVLAWHGSIAFPDMWKHGKNTIGHPYTAQLADGRLFTVYYHFADPFDHTSCRIEGLFWTVSL